jgi:hypothetical protein
MNHNFIEIKPNYSYAEQAGAGTNNVVLAGANTAGVIIYTYNYFCGGTLTELLVGGNTIIGGVGVPAGSNNAQFGGGLIVPAGQSISLVCGAAADFQSITYQILG